MMPGRPDPARRTAWAPLALLLGGAALLRLAASTPPILDGDELWGGISALNVLRGRFPVFFYGQPYHAGLESIVQAVPVFLFGASRWTLRIISLVSGVTFVGLAVLLGRRLLDRRTAWFVGLLAAFPSAGLAKWATSARLHWQLVPIFGLVVLLLAVRVLDPRRRRDPLGVFLLGLLSGLTWYNNNAGVVFLLASGALFLWLRPRQALTEGLAYGVPGFVLGSLPSWIYHVRTGRYFVTPRGTLASPDTYATNLRHFLTRAFAEQLGVQLPPADVWALALAVLAGGAVLLGLGRIVVHAVGGEPRLALVPLVFLAMTAIVTTSVYGERVPSRYILSLFAVVPVLLGAGFGLLARRWPVPAWGLAGVLALANSWAVVTEVSGLTRPEVRASYRAEIAGEQALFAALRARGARTAYAEDYGGLNYTSGGEFVFARTRKDEVHPPFGEQADGAGGAVYVGPRRIRWLEAGLTALGARAEVARAGGWWIYDGFQLADVRVEAIPPDGWATGAFPDPGHAPHAVDGDALTAWVGRGAPDQESWLLVDLGRVEVVSMAAWVPRTHRDAPRDIRVDLSLDGARWERVVSVANYGRPLYWSGTHPFFRLRRPRVEVRFPGTRARYVRLAQPAGVAHTWSVRELALYRPAPPGAAPDLFAVDGLAPRLAARRPRRIYGDHWVLSRLRVVSGGSLPTLPVTTYVDTYGRTDLYRRWAHPPDYAVLDRLRLTPDAVVVLESWTGAVAGFERLLAGSGYAARRERVGEYVVYTDFVAPGGLTGALPREGWRITASVGGALAEQALDGSRATRWTTAGVTPQVPGLTVTIDLGRRAEVGAIELDLGGPSLDYPRGLALQASPDGERWEEVPAAVQLLGPLYWLGTQGARGGVERVRLRFAARGLRAVRLVQTGTDPSYGWSIHEVHLYPAASGAAPPVQS
jgi:4-amino-4-deoxy-L-arabinose transferase-like glycosyltransferase